MPEGKFSFQVKIDAIRGSPNDIVKDDQSQEQKYINQPTSHIRRAGYIGTAKAFWYNPDDQRKKTAEDVDPLARHAKKQSSSDSRLNDPRQPSEKVRIWFDQIDPEIKPW